MSNKQLYEKENNINKPFFPVVRLEDIIDTISEKSIQWILNNYNHIYVEWKNDVVGTRLSVPTILRRNGLWITYNDGDKLITEYYIGKNTEIKDNHWQDDTNWEDYTNKLIDGTVEYRHLSESLKQLFNKGNVTNFPDEEDLTSDGVALSFKDREYDPENFSGLGRVILRKNIVKIGEEYKNILTQSMINKENTIYEIRYDFDLNGKEINIPEGCVLDFQGGSLSNGVLIGTNTNIHANLNIIFKNLNIIGSWITIAVYPEWFGAVGDGKNDDSNFIQKALDFSFNNKLLFKGSNHYRIKNNIYVKEYYPEPHLDNAGNSKIIFDGIIYVDNCDGFICVGSNNHFLFSKVLSENNAGFIKFLDCGYCTVNFSEAYGHGSTKDGIIIAGAYDIGVYGANLIGYSKNIHCRYSNDEDAFGDYIPKKYAPNNPTIKILRIGGSFTSKKIDPLSSNYGIYLDGCNSSWIEAQVEYVVKDENSVGIYISSTSRNINIKTYLESCNKHYIECYGFDCNILCTVMTTNRKLLSDIFIRGYNNVIKYNDWKGKYNAFLSDIVAEGRIDIDKHNYFDKISDNFTIPYDYPYNRIYNPNNLANTWSNSSPTGGTNYPNQELIIDSELSNLGGGYCTKLTSNDDYNIYQKSCSVQLINNMSVIHTSALFKASSDTRVMVKVVNGQTINYKQLIVTNTWRKLNISINVDPIEYPTLDILISYIIPKQESLFISNVCCSEFINTLDIYSNYSTNRPIALGSKNIFQTIGFSGHIKSQTTAITNTSDTELTHLEYPIYKLPITDRTSVITLPSITNNIKNNIVTFITNGNSNGFWRFYTKDLFSTEKHYYNLYNGSITLLADLESKKWIILQESVCNLLNTTNRPSATTINQGYQYFDTTINKPIWWTGTKWVDANGADV